MAFTEKLETRKPRTASEALQAWLDDLPSGDQSAVIAALRDKSWSNPMLKPILEEDEDFPAPAFGMTAFREWRAGFRE